MIALFSHRAYRPYLHLRVSLLLLTALSLSVCVAWAQTSEPQIAASQVRIAQDMELIQIAEQEHRPEAERGALWAQLASEYQYAAEFLKAEDAYNKSLHLLKTAPSARAEYAATLESLAALYLIYGRVDDAESVRKQALAVREKLGNPSDIGLSQVHLADIAIARHQFKKAERLALRGMEEMESSSNPPRAGMLSGLITVTYARCSRGHCGEGLMSAQQAVAFANTHFESESAAVGFALETLGFAEWKNGAVQDGRESYAPRYPDTPDKAGSGRSSPGRRPAAVPGLSNRDKQEGGSTRDSRRSGKDEKSDRNFLFGLYRKRLQFIEDHAIRRICLAFHVASPST